MNIVKFTFEHHDEVSGWWKERGWAPIPLATLPTTGFIVPGVCAGFLYLTDSNLCFLEWVISNPESESQDRSKGLDLLIDELLTEAENLGYKVVSTVTTHPKLILRYEEFGFKKADEQMTNLLRTF